MEPDKQSATLLLKRRADVGVVNHAQDAVTFKFDSVLHNASQASRGGGGGGPKSV